MKGKREGTVKREKRSGRKRLTTGENISNAEQKYVETTDSQDII